MIKSASPGMRRPAGTRPWLTLTLSSPRGSASALRDPAPFHPLARPARSANRVDIVSFRHATMIRATTRYSCDRALCHVWAGRAGVLSLWTVLVSTDSAECSRAVTAAEPRSPDSAGFLPASSPGLPASRRPGPGPRFAAPAAAGVSPTRGSTAARARRAAMAGAASRGESVPSNASPRRTGAAAIRTARPT
jgi:hypothetical protein